MDKQYLGDSVYVDFDGHMLKLTTENGYGPTNTIHLELEVWFALQQYVARLTKKAPVITVECDPGASNVRE